MASKLFDLISNLSFRQVVIVALVISLIMFSVAGLSIWFLLEQKNHEEVETVVQEPEPPQISMVQVVTANVTIAPKTILKEEMLTLKELPSDSAPPEAFTTIAEVVGKPTKIAIHENEIVTPSKVYDSPNQIGFVGTIPPDCRAVSVNVNDVTGVAGFAKPGDRVDIMLVERDDGVATTRVILQDVLLLSINQNMGVYKNNEDDATKAIDNPSIATLALPPEDGLKLISASKIGEIYLMLRPSQTFTDYAVGDEFTVKSSKAKTAEVKKEIPPPAVEEKKPEEKVEPVAPPTIEILYGDKPAANSTKQSQPNATTATPTTTETPATTTTTAPVTEGVTP